MDMDRRNSLKDWWDDIGFIYAIVVAFLALIFLVRHIEHVPAARPERPAANIAAHADRR